MAHSAPPSAPPSPAIEKLGAYDSTPSLKLDGNALPLSPQPSNDAADPLNYPAWVKMTILLQVSALALISVLHVSISNPAYLPMAAELRVTVNQVAYQATLGLATAGVAPFIWIPIANVWGRRPVYLACALSQALLGFLSGRVKSFSSLLIVRAFMGFTTGAPQVLGAATVVDLFFLHERGVKMGVFTVFLNSGGHLSALLGGFLGQFISWRWCFYFSSILSLAMFAIMLVALPETLYSRRPDAQQSYSSQPSGSSLWLRKLSLWGHRLPQSKLRFIDGLRPLEMAYYPAVLIPAACYAVAFCFGSIEPAITAAFLFAKYYHFKPSQIGLASGVATLIGSITGELCSGVVIDAFMARSRKKDGDKAQPEVRLQGIWPGAFALVAGLCLYGFSVQHRTHFLVPCVGNSMASFGVQVISTVCYAYIADSYRSQTSDGSQLINFFRNMLGFTLGFYSLPFGERAGFDMSFLTFSLIWLIIFFTPMLWLMRYGRVIRDRQGAPTWNVDL